MTKSAFHSLADPTLSDCTRTELAAWLERELFSPAHALPLFKRLQFNRQTPIAQWHDLPARLRRWVQERGELPLPTVAREAASADGLTWKFALRLSDGAVIETVRMLHRERVTACVSSQVGCPLACVFCATGQAGFTRNLTTAEIVAQAHFVRAIAGNMPPLKNIVLMGMGEPLLNYDAVLRAVEILCDPAGLALGGKQVTLSTVGVIPGIVRLADERRPVSLAVSLHAADQDERAALVPLAKSQPLPDLMDACRYYVTQTGRKIFFEWTLIAGRNDSPQQARQLAELVRGLECQVNLIPLNPTEGYAGLPGNRSALDRFRAELQAHGVPVSIRQRRGIDVAAGCGQLAGAE